MNAATATSDQIYRDDQVTRQCAVDGCTKRRQHNRGFYFATVCKAHHMEYLKAQRTR
jgi:hypothetical protein